MQKDYGRSKKIALLKPLSNPESCCFMDAQMTGHELNVFVKPDDRAVKVCFACAFGHCDL